MKNAVLETALESYESNVSMQTWISGEQFDKFHTETDKSEAKKKKKNWKVFNSPMKTCWI